MERTSATSTNILELITVQPMVPVDSAPTFRGHIFPDLLVDSTSVKRNMEEHRIPVKPINRNLKLAVTNGLPLINSIIYYVKCLHSPKSFYFV